MNLVAVSGILVGLIVGGNNANREQFTSNVILTKLSGKTSITNTPNIDDFLSHSPYVNKYSVRYGAGASIRAGYTSRSDFSKKGEESGTQLLGIDVEGEDNLTHLSRYVKEGEYLDPNETGYILIGANLLKRYNSSFGDQFDSISNLYTGDKVMVTIGDKTAEFIVKGIVNTKVGEVSMRAFIPRTELNTLLPEGSQNAVEIAVETIQPNYDALLKQSLIDAGFDTNAKIQTSEEAIPNFLNQIKLAFGVLGNMIGLIGLIVAATTIFIVIFMNAVTRQKYIGILKGIGISPRVIIWSYIFQSLFYAILGGIIASVIIYFGLVPLIERHPIDFPFSDGILSAPIAGTVTRFLILLIISFFAGFVPAWRIVRRNTLNSILGR
jgi:putative ABC transport system permease protein